jgi:Cys-rich four helix bundle protein (predicted Tat secretion target)
MKAYMERREMLKNAAATMVVAASSFAMAQEPDHKHEHGAAKKYAGLIATSGDCVKTGEACLAHTLVLLGKGEKELGACAQSVNELLAACTALQKLAGQDSRYTARYAKLTADVCADSEKECRKFEKKHAECKACADACAACIKECQKLAA